MKKSSNEFRPSEFQKNQADLMPVTSEQAFGGEGTKQFAIHQKNELDAFKKLVEKLENIIQEKEVEIAAQKLKLASQKEKLSRKKQALLTSKMEKEAQQNIIKELTKKTIPKLEAKIADQEKQLTQNSQNAIANVTDKMIIGQCRSDTSVLKTDS